MLFVLIVHAIYHFQYEIENRHKLTQICSYGIFSKGLKNEFETAVVNEPSVFEPLKFYCNVIYNLCPIPLSFPNNIFR